jgi:hypothetical protein
VRNPDPERRRFFLVFKAQNEALRSYAGKAYVQKPSIALYHILSEVAPDGNEEPGANRHRNGLEISSFKGINFWAS